MFFIVWLREGHWQIDLDTHTYIYIYTYIHIHIYICMYICTLYVYTHFLIRFCSAHYNSLANFAAQI